MKLRKSKLAKFADRKAVANNEESEASHSSESSSQSTGWKVQGREDTRSMLERQKAEAARRYPPEFWLRTDEEKLIRFRKSEPLCCFTVYSLKVGGRFIRVTAPPAGDRDLFREAGKKAGFRALYEILDVTGYVSKEGKTMTNVPRFFLVNSRLFEQLESINKKKGGLTKFDLSIKKVGTGVNTTYVVLPEDPSPCPALDRVQSLAGDVDKFYAPPSVEEQRSLLGQEQPSDR